MTSSTSKGTSSDETSSLPAFQEKGKAARTGSAASPSEAGLGSGKGSAGKGASRSPVKKPAEDAERRGPRRVRLTLARIDPFSVMKLSFLVALAIGLATVVAVVLLWNLVDAIGLWAQVDQLGRDLNGGDALPFMDFFSFSKFVSYGTVVAVVNVVIITALGTLLAFLYNLVAALLGGLKFTFTDD